MSFAFERGRQYGDLTVGLWAKHPYKTWNLIIYYPDKHFPDAIGEDLKRAGWERDGWEKPPFRGRMEATFYKSGTDIFNSWTPDEQKSRLKEVRAILKKHGITQVPNIRLTLQDLL